MLFWRIWNIFLDQFFDPGKICIAAYIINALIDQGVQVRVVNFSWILNNLWRYSLLAVTATGKASLEAEEVWRHSSYVDKSSKALRYGSESQSRIRLV